MSKIIGGVVVLCAALLAVGCGPREAAPDAEAAGAEPELIRRLDVVLDSKSGSELTGIAMFVQDGSGVTLQLNLENTPAGDHAVHIHETGDCSADDAGSAGGHWNPGAQAHGEWGVAPFHLGDIGNVTIGEDGTGSLTFTTDAWSLGAGDAADLLGRAIVVHAQADDFTTQPTGAAGGRIGCGVIRQ